MSPTFNAPRSGAGGGHADSGGHAHTHDHDHAHTHDGQPCDGHAHDHARGGSPAAAAHACCSHDHGHAVPVSARVSADEREIPAGAVISKRLIAQMDCPNEEGLIRQKLGAMAAVHALEFNLMQRMLTVVHAAGALGSIDDAIRELGMTPRDIAPPGAGQAAAAPAAYWKLAIAGIAAVGAEIAHWMAAPAAVAAVLAVVAIALSGLGTYKKGWIAIRHFALNINALMSIAVTGAILIGQWPEAAMVMFLFAIAELIEAKSLDRARNAVGNLMRLAPDTVTVRLADGSWGDVLADSVAIDAMARVRPGGRVALDGVVAEGRSTIDQAAITGESLPVEKAPGDVVYAGTVNGAGAFEYRVTALAADTTLARIIHAVEHAQGVRAPMQRWVDQFAHYYTPIVVLAAIGVALLPPLLMGGLWLDWIYKALVLLVIACPCALVISTPVTVVSGLAEAARQGILIKGGVFLEQGRKLRWLALDKTGTLTTGRPRQTDFHAAPGESSARVRQLAVSLAERSDHPVSRAIAEAGRADTMGMLDVADFTAVAGRGVQGSIGGTRYYLGNRRFMSESGISAGALQAQVDALERTGKSLLLLGSGNAVLAVFAVADTVRATSREAVERLRQMGVSCMVLSGDHDAATQAVAKALGIDSAQGGLLPEDKTAAIEAKIAAGGRVGMVGDGINDAPALARADIGFAMGAAGTDAAIETADVALMDDDLRKVARFIALSRRTHAILVQNIALALGIKLIFLILTLLGMGTLWMAVFADVGASLLVVANGLRLMRPMESRAHAAQAVAA